MYLLAGGELPIKKELILELSFTLKKTTRVF
jgi:hypothetical protein